MFEITIIEVNAGPIENSVVRTERLRLTTDMVDVMAVARVAIGGKRKRKGNSKEKAA